MKPMGLLEDDDILRCETEGAPTAQVHGAGELGKLTRMKKAGEVFVRSCCSPTSRLRGRSKFSRLARSDLAPDRPAAE
jgi:hypothetical protein